MFIKFKTLKLKNLLSYGNNLTELNFENGLTLVTAQNGDGKSALFLDALSYALFGKPYRKIKNKELINRTNKKGLWTQVEFEIDGKTYILTRGMSPDVLEISVDGQEFSLLSSKTLNQEEIDKIIGCDYNLFKHVICLSINYNKAFFSLSLQEKRDIIESIFNIKIFAEMMSKIKKQLSASKMELDLKSSEERNIEHTMISLNNQIKSLKLSAKNFDQEKKAELEKLIPELESLIKEKEEIEEEIKSTAVSQKVETRNLLKTIDEVKSKGTKANSKIEEIDDKLKFMETTTLCPVCNSELDEEHKRVEIEKLNENKIKLNSQIDQFRVEYKELNKNLKSAEETNKKIEEIERELFIKNRDKENILRSIERLEKTIKSVQNRKLDFDISSLKNEFDNQKERYQVVSDKVVELAEQLKILESCSSVLGDRGIKAFFYKRLIPILNAKINTYLDRFDLPVKITFNETMDEYIDSLSGHGRNISYNAFSEGEKKRIDIALMLSFIETTKTISNWNSNILIFDEIFDSATDSTGLDKIMDSIKQMTEENRNLCCYVISHREADHQNYTGRIVIKKQDGFSTIN